LKELIGVYNEVDLKIETFKKRWGVDCLEGCSRCCEIPSRRIEVSILELIPLSLHLWEEGEAEKYLERSNSIGDEDLCVLYRPGIYCGSGRCGFYQFRPFLCRLFGFSVVEDKSGRPRLSLCRWIKKEVPGIKEKLKNLIDGGCDLPINSHYARRIVLLYPLYSQEFLPINSALKRALEVVGLRLSLLRRSSTYLLQENSININPHYFGYFPISAKQSRILGMTNSLT